MDLSNIIPPLIYVFVGAFATLIISLLIHSLRRQDDIAKRIDAPFISKPVSRDVFDSYVARVMERIEKLEEKRLISPQDKIELVEMIPHITEITFSLAGMRASNDMMLELLNRIEKRLQKLEGSQNDILNNLERLTPPSTEE